MVHVSEQVSDVSIQHDGSMQVTLAKPTSKYLKVIYSDGTFGTQLYWLDGKEGQSFRLVANKLPVKTVLLSDTNKPVNTFGDQIVLDRLYVDSDREYSDAFRLRSSRPKNQVLVYFIARQISRNFPGSPHFRIGASVVESYKACELGSSSLAEEALVQLDRARSDLAYCKVDASPRVNREHLQFSILCAEIHLRLLLNQRIEMESTVALTKHVISDVSNMQTPSFPLSMILLLDALTARVEERSEDFTKTLGLMEAVFKRSVVDASINNATWFGELRVVHQALWLALNLRDQYSNWSQSQEIVKKCFERSVRVAGSPLDILYKNYSEMLCVDSK